MRVARGGKASIDKDAPRRIVAGIGDSEGALLIIESIAARRWTRDSVLTILTATDTFNADPVHPLRQVIGAQEFHAAAREKLAATGLKILTRVTEGDARGELLAEAEKLSADCIFVGTRDIRGTLDRFFIDSVSSGVTINAPCSVEVVRSGAN